MAGQVRVAIELISACSMIPSLDCSKMTSLASHRSNARRDSEGTPYPYVKDQRTKARKLRDISSRFCPRSASGSTFSIRRLDCSWSSSRSSSNASFFLLIFDTTSVARCCYSFSACLEGTMAWINESRCMAGRAAGCTLVVVIFHCSNKHQDGNIMLVHRNYMIPVKVCVTCIFFDYFPTYFLA